MSLLGASKLAAISLAGVSGTVGVVYVGGKAVDFSGVQDEDDSIIETVSDKFKTRLVTSDAKSNKWEARLKKLRDSNEQNLDPELKKIKEDKEKKQGDLKKWCDSAVIQPYDENSLVTKGIEAFCTWTIKDQVRNTISEKGTEKWTSATEKLKNFDTSKLSGEMKKLQEDIKKGTDSGSLEKWCFESYEQPFTDTKNSKYLDVSSFCVKIPVPKVSKPAATKPTSVKAQDTASPAPVANHGS
ncbi:hypothetical protein HF1_07350 [Mycoplasma haemofelis str. Langford 1]|uniref:Uncharacterized protein n=1 Tax=Mycoplasma haemofelis (strain Langford 1) TaxID=941640 RepID=E8ZHX2_MYCHL|nr:hypothetical protein [Mycoplasma haemofelis]CBY92743.1 hypothetical protein HF1_07350 [Mycoplasma haemofelis str. Langford 1]